MIQSQSMVAFALCILIGLSHSLPEGAPTKSCETLYPEHAGIQPDSSPSPFSFIPSSNAVRQGQSLLLEIRATPAELKFGGFMIHAIVPGHPDQIIGRFVFSAPTDNVKLLECGEPDSTVTHANPNLKASGLTLQWQAPKDFRGQVVFKGAVAQQYAQYWVDIQSRPVQVVGEDDDLPTDGSYQPNRPAVPPIVPAFRPEVSQNANLEMIDAIYSGCAESKTCFGFPEGCVQLGNCNSVGTVTVQGDRYHFEIKSSRNNPAYVAMALSMDDKMGDDSVMECVPERGIVKAYTSWTSGLPNYGASRDNVPQNIVRLLEGSVIDGSIYCRLERDVVSTVMGQRFDLVNDQFHLLVASGSSLKAGGVGYHDIGRIASGAPRSLADVSAIGGKSVLLLRLHAAFMLAAWIGTASAGILLARYFKQTWVGSSMCGKDQWFAWHRTLMVLTWVLTIVGFVLIFVELGGWSAEQNPHAILGTVTTVLCFIQPFGALFRPAPTHRNRPIFNWLHWLVGNFAHILAIVTIFFAVKLTKAELPEWFDWILVGFVAFHVFMHILLSIAGCVSDRSQQQRINTFPMSDITPTRGSAKDRKMDAPYAGLRKGLLAIYLIIVLLFVVALIVIATLAPIEQTFDTVRTRLTN